MGVPDPPPVPRLGSGTCGRALTEGWWAGHVTRSGVPVGCIGGVVPPSNRHHPMATTTTLQFHAASALVSLATLPSSVPLDGRAFSVDVVDSYYVRIEAVENLDRAARERIADAVKAAAS